MTGTNTQRIAIVGTGLIGSGWALHFLRLGCDVVAFDPDRAAERRLRVAVDRGWPLMQRLGLRPGADPGRLVFSPAAAQAAADAGIVLECAPERLATKQALFEAMDAAAGPETLLFSCSSSFPVSDIRVRTRYPDRCLLGHPFNPPQLLPLVEVAGGPRGARPVERAMAFWESVEKVPVHLRRELPGHLVNRLTAALFREAVHLVAEDVADVADIDRAVAFGPGLRLALAGPFLTYHLGGGVGGIEHYFEHLGPSQEARWATLGKPALTADLVARVVAGVEAEARGRGVDALAAERDEGLVQLLALLRQRPGADRKSVV